MINKGLFKSSLSLSYVLLSFGKDAAPFLFLLVWITGTDSFMFIPYIANCSYMKLVQVWRAHKGEGCRESDLLSSSEQQTLLLHLLTDDSHP